MSRLPSLNALRTFECVARLGSLRAAADQLHVTTSAVSHQLKKLEDDLGVRLLERTPQSVVLTEAGALYFESLRPAFDQLVAATERVRKDPARQCVSVTTLPVFAIKWLIRQLGEFHQLHPTIEVRISSTYKVLDLRHADHDLGIRWGDGAWPDVQSERLMGDVIQPVCSPAYRRAHAALGPTPSLEGHRLICMHEDGADWKLWAALQGTAMPDGSPNLHLMEPTSAIQAALDGLGMVLGPHALVGDDLASGRLVPAHDDLIGLGEAYYLVSRPRATLSKASQQFKKWLIALCSRQDAAHTHQVVRTLEAGALSNSKRRPQ